MSQYLENLNFETLNELYAYWYHKVYNRFPKAGSNNITKKYLIRKINKLQYQYQSNGA